MRSFRKIGSQSDPMVPLDSFTPAEVEARVQYHLTKIAAANRNEGNGENHYDEKTKEEKDPAVNCDSRALPNS